MKCGFSERTRIGKCGYTEVAKRHPSMQHEWKRKERERGLLYHWDKEDLTHKISQLLAITIGYWAIWLGIVISLEVDLIGKEGESTGKAMVSFS